MTAQSHHDFTASGITRITLRRAGTLGRASERRWAMLLVAAMVAALWCGWIGYIASDDSLYYDGAVRWLDSPPFAGDTHWSTRFPLTLSFAAVIAIVGRNLAAFAVTAVLFYAGLVAVTGLFAARVAGRRAGWIAAILAATLPVIVSNASSVGVDLVEASAILIGAMLLGDARDDRAGLRKGALAGVAFGIAMLCRETTALPLVGLAPLFLLGRPVPRRVLIASGIGFAAVIGAEAAFQFAMTGDPLRRYGIAFHHDEHIDRAANMEGNVLLWPPIDPLLVLLINDDFGLLFWVAGFAAATGTLRAIGDDGRRRLWVLAAMALASFLLVGALYSKLVLNPRYFTLPALVAVVVVAVWLDRMGGRARALWLAALVGSSLLLMSVGNAHPRWTMESMVAAAVAHPGEPVFGDANDVKRAAQSLAFAGQGTLRPGPPPPGALVIAPADAVPAGQVVARYPSPPTRAGAVLRALGAEAFVPAAIARRMFAPSPATVLVRTPAA